MSKFKIVAFLLAVSVAAADLVVVTDQGEFINGQPAHGGTSAAIWGGIVGTLANQTDLNDRFLAIEGSLSRTSNWDSAFSWGNHATNGYLLPIATNSLSRTGNWDTAYGWGNHSTNGYLSPASTNSLSNTGNWDTAYSWGNHATNGYLKSCSTNTISEVLTKGNDMAGLGMTNGFANLTRLSLRTNVIITSGDGLNVGIEVLAAPVSAGGTQTYGTWAGYAALSGGVGGAGNSAFGFAALQNSDSDTACAFGYSALINSTGNDNVAMGNNALGSITGSGNVGIGPAAGQGALATVGMTAVGKYAGQNAGGSLNTAIGSEAMKLTTGNNNTALGGNSGQQAPATNAVSVGVNAGTLSPGNENVAIGYVAHNSSTGDYNTAVGAGSLWLSPGNENSALGVHALYGTPGSYNTAVGNESGRASTGSWNTAIGYSAGYLSGGSANTFIGKASGASAVFTVYSNATTLGADVAPKGNNTVNIGLSNQTTYVDGALMVQNTNIGQQVAMIAGWGNHATNSYLLPAATNSLSKTSDWNTAFGWGNHATNSYLLPAATNSLSKTSDWNTAFGWGSHATNNYLLPSATNSLSRTGDWNTAYNNYFDKTGGVINGSITILGDLYAVNAWITNVYVTNLWTTITNLDVRGSGNITGDLVVGRTNSALAFIGGARGLSNNVLWDAASSNAISATGDLSIVKANTSNWNAAFGWGNHSTNNYNAMSNKSGWAGARVDGPVSGYGNSLTNFGSISANGTMVMGWGLNLVNIDGTALGARQFGQNNGSTMTIGAGSLGSDQSGFNEDTLTIGMETYGARQGGRFSNTNSIGDYAVGAQQLGRSDGRMSIGSWAIGAQQYGWLTSQCSASNNASGAMQLFKLTVGQHALTTVDGESSLLLGAGIVSNKNAIVAGDGNVSHGDASISATTIWGSNTNIGQQVAMIAGWGNHSTNGYLLPAATNSLSKTSDWNTAFGWGNHSTNGYLLPASTNSLSKTSNWNTAFGWGNHSTNNYLTNGATASLNGTGVTNLPLNSGFEFPLGQLSCANLTMAFTNATRTLTLVPVGTCRYTTANRYWWTLTTNAQVQISDTEGLHYIYFAPLTGVLTESTIPWTVIGGEAQIAQLYWDKVNQVAIMFFDERHGKDIADTDHLEHHSLEGAKWYSGGNLIYNITNGVPSTSGSNTVLSIQNCTMWDDDITNNNPGLGNQTAIGYTNDGAYFPIIYATGAVASVAWRTNGYTPFPFILSPDGSRPVYNSLTAGVWGTNAVPEDNYFISWIIQTPNYGSTNGLKLIPDSVVSTTLTGAQARTYVNILENRSVNISGEFKPLYRVICLYNAAGGGSYSALVKSTKIVDVQDLRLGNQNPAVSVGSASADLSVFLRKDGTTPLEADWGIGGCTISNGNFVGNGSGLTNINLGHYHTNSWMVSEPTPIAGYPENLYPVHYFPANATLVSLKTGTGGGTVIFDLWKRYYTNAPTSYAIIATVTSSVTAANFTFTEVVSNGWSIGFSTTNVASSTSWWAEVECVTP